MTTATPGRRARKGGVPEATVARLPVYHRALTALAERGVATVSSEELAVAAGRQLRQAAQGPQPTSAPTAPAASATTSTYLLVHIARELGLTQDWPVVIVGVGNLGQALANYGGFGSRGFASSALVDADPAGSARPSPASTIRPLDDLERVVADARRQHRRHRHPGGRGAGRLRPAGRRRRHEHPQLRADRPRRGRRGRPPQGRPRHRAADPRLPRAAQVRPRGGGAQ